jgi:hypothetical protein
VSLLQQNERGLPDFPRTISVEGRWMERATVRPLPAVVGGVA